MTTNKKAPECCERCRDPLSMYAKTYGSGLGIPGYAVNGDTKEYVCYKCASLDEQKFMRKRGRTTLYLTTPEPRSSNNRITGASVGDWSGQLSIPCTNVQVGKTYVPRVGYLRRYDAWFQWEGFYWHGVQYGDMTQLIHCKRTKEKVR